MLRLCMYIFISVLYMQIFVYIQGSFSDGGSLPLLPYTIILRENLYQVI